VKRLNSDSLKLIRQESFSDGPAQIAVKIRDKSSGAGFGDDDAFAFELAIGLGNCIGIYSELRGQLPDGRQLFIFDEPAQGDVTLDLVYDLPINGSVRSSGL
jgi:hypothetical protein